MKPYHKGSALSWCEYTEISLLWRVSIFFCKRHSDTMSLSLVLFSPRVEELEQVLLIRFGHPGTVVG